MSVVDEFKSDLEKVSAVSNVYVEGDKIYVKVDGRDYPNFAGVVDEYRGKGITMVENDTGAVREYVFSA